MDETTQSRVRAEINRLLLQVPDIADREFLESCSSDFRTQARWERGMCDNHSAAEELHKLADICELAAQVRFPREGDRMVEIMSTRIAHDLSAKHWTCIRCGAVERLNHHPDCCSFCGGSMECDDGRTTSSAGEPEVPFDVYHAAAEGDLAATIELWHLGAPLGPPSQQTLDELMLQNRQEQLLSLFAEAA